MRQNILVWWVHLDRLNFRLESKRLHELLKRAVYWWNDFGTTSSQILLVFWRELPAQNHLLLSTIIGTKPILHLPRRRFSLSINTTSPIRTCFARTLSWLLWNLSSVKYCDFHLCQKCCSKEFKCAGRLNNAPGVNLIFNGSISSSNVLSNHRPEMRWDGVCRFLSGIAYFVYRFLSGVTNRSRIQDTRHHNDYS